MKTKMTLSLIVLGVMLGLEAQAFYNPSTGRWLSRDPLGDANFLRDHVKGKPETVVQKTVEESLMPPYLFVRNDSANGIDVFGLESEPDVSWAPAPCPKGQITAFVQVVVGYKWSKGPHVDNGNLGPKSSSSSGCPLYPLPSNMNQVFQDSPRGWTGPVQFIVCRVCLEPCCFLQSVRGGGYVSLGGQKIVSVGPCVYWKKGDKGDLSDSSLFTRVEGPNQNWQVGMDTDFPVAAKGGCFKCAK